MKVVGLTGVAGSGKSTVAQYLVEEHSFSRLSFAAPLKKMLRTLDPYLGYDRDFSTRPRLSELTGDLGLSENDIKNSPFGAEYRRLLQVLSTDCIRAVDEDFWVNAATDQMTDDNGKYVFDDVRFPNEAQVIAKISPWGLWNITRRGYGAVNGHASEQHAGQMGERQFISNNSSLKPLHKYVDMALAFAFESKMLVP